MAAPFQGSYPESFDREQGFTPADWLRCLPGAVRQHALDLTQPGMAKEIGRASCRERVCMLV